MRAVAGCLLSCVLFVFAFLSLCAATDVDASADRTNAGAGVQIGPDGNALNPRVLRHDMAALQARGTGVQVAGSSASGREQAGESKGLGKSEGEDEGGLVVESVEPNTVWVFGGVVARINGQDLGTATSVTFAGVSAHVIAQTVTSVDVIVPEYHTPFSEPSINVPVTVTSPNGEATLPASAENAFTYVHYQLMGDTITTAFKVTDEDPTKPIALDAGGSFDLTKATLTLPLADMSTPLMSSVYVLVRATQDPAAVGTTTENVPGTPVAGAWDFSVHVYDPVVTNNEAAPGEAVHPEVHLAFERGAGRDSATLMMPVESVSPRLTSNDIESIVSAWAVETDDYDYGLNPENETVSAPLVVVYESSVLEGEFAPPRDSEGESTIESVTVRLYDLGSFTLRKNSADMILMNIRPSDLTVTPNIGPTSGGTQVVITAVEGGLGYIDRVTFGNKEVQRILTPPGTDEYTLEVVPPTSFYPGVVNISVYLGSDPLNRVTILAAFCYKSEWGCFGSLADSSGIRLPLSFAGDLLLVMAAIMLLAAGGIRTAGSGRSSTSDRG
jgi:hypothetical protein